MSSTSTLHISCFVSMVFLIFVSASAPTWNSVYFLRASNGESNFHFGVFGYTGTKARVGYHFPVTTGKLASPSIHHLTYTLVLHPIAAGLCGLGVLFGLCGVDIWSSLAKLVTVIAFVLDIALFSIARHEFHKLGWTAEYGNAMWLTLVGVIGTSFLRVTFTSGSHAEQSSNFYVTYQPRVLVMPGSGAWRRW